MLKARSSGRVPRILGLIFAAAGLLCVFIGTWNCWRQGSLLRRCQPVSATITGTHIDGKRVSGRRTRTEYSSVVEFTFRFGDVLRQGNQPMPIRSTTSSHAAAQAIVDRFHPGQEVMAWVDPRDPSTSFLIHEADFSPYVFILFPMLHFSFGLLMLLPGGSEVANQRRYRLPALVWWLVGAAVAVHYAHCNGQWTVLPIIALSLYGLIGIGWLIAWRRSPLIYV